MLNSSCLDLIYGLSPSHPDRHGMNLKNSVWLCVFWCVLCVSGTVVISTTADGRKRRNDKETKLWKV